jgi:hypothetical protein
MRIRRRTAGVGGFVEVGDAVVQPVDGQRVLDQVVGADAEEPDVFGEAVGDHHGGGDFDHGADFHPFVEGPAFGAEFLAAFVEQGVGLDQFVHAGDHGGTSV